MRSVFTTVLRMGSVGVLAAVFALPAVGQSTPTEIFIPGGAFALDNDRYTSYRGGGGCVGGQCFFSQGLWLPDDRGIVKAGTTFWVPTAWYDQEIEIILMAHSGAFIGTEVRIFFEIGNLFDQELTAWVGSEDGGGSEVELLTTTLGSTDPAPGGSVLVNRRLQGILVGINSDHPEHQGFGGYGILGLLIRPTGN